jgi:hypothetical protein
MMILSALPALVLWSAMLGFVVNLPAARRTKMSDRKPNRPMKVTDLWRETMLCI